MGGWVSELGMDDAQRGTWFEWADPPNISTPTPHERNSRLIHGRLDPQAAAYSASIADALKFEMPMVRARPADANDSRPR